MPVSIRAIRLEDAEHVARLYAQSAAHLRSLGDTTDFRFTAEAYRRDGFGANAAFSGIIAEIDGQPVGHLLYTLGYDTDSASRFVFVIDLVVDEDVRSRGIGRTLMQHASAICRDAGGAFLLWAVYEKNELAIEFYRRLGAERITGGQFMTLTVQAIP